MSAAVRIFVGSGPRHAVEETVLVQSMLRSTSRLLEIDIIDCGRHCLRRVGTDETRPLPEAWRGRLAGEGDFSYARFAPPELCGYGGRAIYCEVDQLVLGDIAELWDYPLHDAAFAAVPFEAHRGDSPSYQTEGFLSSVLVFDAARCRSMSVPAITNAVRCRRLDYQDAISLTDRCREAFDLHVGALPARWNDLERRQDDTGILHFTESGLQPWLYPRHPESDLWISVYLTCVDEGLLDSDELDEARRFGRISARVRALPRLPRSWVRPVDELWQRAEQLRRRAR